MLPPALPKSLRFPNLVSNDVVTLLLRFLCPHSLLPGSYTPDETDPEVCGYPEEEYVILGRPLTLDDARWGDQPSLVGQSCVAGQDSGSAASAAGQEGSVTGDQ